MHIKCKEGGREEHGLWSAWTEWNGACGDDLEKESRFRTCLLKGELPKTMVKCDMDTDLHYFYEQRPCPIVDRCDNDDYCDYYLAGADSDYYYDT